MKRVLTLTLAVFLTLFLGACGGKSETESVDSSAVPRSATLSEDKSIERKLIRVVQENYTQTHVGQVSVQENADTEEPGDYSVQAELTWEAQDQSDHPRQTLVGFSDDFSTRVSKETPNVSALTVSWIVPGIDAEKPSVTCVYERKGGAMQMLDRTISDELGGTDGGTEDASADQTETGEGSAEQTTADQSGQPDAISLDDAVTVVEAAVKSSYGSDFTLTHDDHSITFGVWRDGVAENALRAQSGDADSMTAWRNLVSSNQSLSSTMSNLLKSAGFQDVSVTVNILNDLNHDNTLLTVTDGAITYNWVEPV